jgi:hypothetical protein
MVRDPFSPFPRLGNRAGGLIAPIRKWLYYADQEVASLRRSRIGSIAPISNIYRTATTATLLEMAMQNDELFSSSDRERMECSRKCTVHDQMNPAGMTMSAPPCLSLLDDMVIDGTPQELGPLMMVVRQTQGVVKIARRRHGLSPFGIVGEQSRNVVPWRRFFYAGHRRRVSDEPFTGPFSTRLLVRPLSYTGNRSSRHLPEDPK